MKDLDSKLIMALTEDHADYLSDESHTQGYASWIAFPKNEDEVRRALRAAGGEGIPTTVQGARTGITAGSVPFGGQVLSLGRMNRILGMRRGEEGRYYLRVQPGLALSELSHCVESKLFVQTGWDQASLEAHASFLQAGEYFFPPDPTERSASLGGMAACNASGARTYLYGATRNYISALRVVLPDGRTVALRRGEVRARGLDLKIPAEDGSAIRVRIPTYRMPETKNASGYFAAPDMDAIDLFIGSDGTLGVITELEIMILPLPSHIWAVTAFFAGERQALDYVLSVRRGIKQVAAVEYFDGDALNILRSQKKNNGAFSKLPELPEDGRAAVYVEFHCEGEDTARMRLLEAVALMEAAGGSEEKTLIACDGNELKTLHFLRHAIPESVNMLIRQRKKKDPVITKLGTDMAVPDEYLLEVMEMYRRGLREENLESAVWGHIGNNHVHVNILPGSAEEYHRGKALYQKWAREVARMGGAVSAEHAVGKLKADFLAAMYGPGHIGEMRALKNAFDPGNLIGRGNLFGLEAEARA